MWSRFNAVGMRQRWGTLKSDPGRTCRLGVPAKRGSGSGGARGVERVKRAFLSGEAVVECATRGCPGLYIAARRELGASPGGGSRVLLVCTRTDEGHSVTLQLRPYDENEVGKLQALRERGEPLSCPRCAGSMREAEGSGSGLASDANPVIYECEWCGVRWRPSRGGRSRLAG